MRQIFYKNILVFVLCWPSIAGLWPPLKCGSYTQWDSIGVKEFFLCKQLSVGDRLLVNDGYLYTFPPLSAGAPTGLDLCRPYACCHSLCEFTCVTVLCVFCWCHSFPHTLSILPSLQHSLLGPKGRSLVNISHLRLSVPKSRQDFLDKNYFSGVWDVDVKWTFQCALLTGAGETSLKPWDSEWETFCREEGLLTVWALHDPPDQLLCLSRYFHWLLRFPCLLCGFEGERTGCTK